MSDLHNSGDLDYFNTYKTDLILSGGDNTNDGLIMDYYKVFRNCPQIPFLSAYGNHDRRNLNIFQRDIRNYY